MIGTLKSDKVTKKKVMEGRRGCFVDKSMLKEVSSDFFEKYYVVIKSSSHF